MSYLKALNVLRGGGIITFPTDTVMGIGCAMDKPDAIKRLYEIKRRSKKEPTAVLVADTKMSKMLTKDIPESIYRR